MKDTKREHEDWIVGIQCLHPMITALIDINDDIAVFTGWGQGNYPRPGRQ